MATKRTAILNVEIEGKDQPTTVNRIGKDSSGNDYRLSITVSGVTVDDQEIPSALAANFIADRIEAAFKQAKKPKRTKRKVSP